jgi:phospholipid/cholesterol/gamma-HCH transport system substrate-binding protein
VIASLSSTTKALDKMINAESQVLGKTLSNVEAVTGTLARNSGTIDTTLKSLQRTTSALADAHIEETLRSVTKTMNRLDETIATINSKKGSIGMLLNDRQLYDELRMTNRSLTTLLDDVRMNPKRYVSISVFGKKTKSGPILQPVIYDSTSVK